jgi:hypothetical protein
MTDEQPLRTAFRRGESDEVRRLAEEQVAEAHRIGDTPAEVEGLYALARVSLRAGDLTAARALAEDALAVARDSGRIELTERPLHVLAAIARLSGDHSGATVLYEASIDLNTALGNAVNVHTESHNLAMTELRLGNIDRARLLITEGQDRVRRGGLRDFVPYLGLAGAALASTEGDARRAARLIGFTMRAFAHLNQVPDPDDAQELSDLRDRVSASLGDDATEAEVTTGSTWSLTDAFGGSWGDDD